MPPNQTYDERRAEVKESTRRSIKKARTADRQVSLFIEKVSDSNTNLAQARNRARQNRRAKPDYKHLTKAQQTAATAAAEEHVMESRCREGIDGDSHLTKALDEESAKLYAIDSEENTEKLKKLPTSASPVRIPFCNSAVVLTTLICSLSSPRWQKEAPAKQPSRISTDVR